jgi:hypothetical protein
MNWFGEFSLEWSSEFTHESARGTRPPSSKPYQQFLTDTLYENRLETIFPEPIFPITAE